MPTPMEGETQSEYVSRCIGVRQNENPNEDTKQSSAVCYSMWDQHKKEDAAKLEKIKEVTDPGELLSTEHGDVSISPEAVTAGQLPEWPDVDIPEGLKATDPFTAGRQDFPKE